MPLWKNVKRHFSNSEHRTMIKEGLLNVPKSLYQALPAVLLGVLFNALDAVSTGLLIFPSEKQSTSLGSLQMQAMSMYIMSTLMSQITMTLGGSLFPGALGSMLIEVLPFLRAIASNIQAKLGDEDPHLIPTVLAAYALTSFLVGAVFTALAVARCGRLVEYFPQTVLTGAIGAIGMSLFLLALELTLPPAAAVLSLGSARDVLFNSQHITLLIASFLPALFLSVSIRLQSLARVSSGFTQHALYVPVYMFVIVGVFWISVAGRGSVNASGINHLANQGWLFTVRNSTTYDTINAQPWNYWTYFNFSMVRWSAMSNALQDIILLVVIGVLNLPIYIPAMALALDVPVYNMNHELLGHGISNILAGAVGTVPNLVVFSYTRFFTLAGGGRFEATIVIVITIGLFFVSSFLLPYAPTILASTLVFFLGLELMTEALWESTKSMIWCEWFVVFGTFLACTFWGFAPGFGVGLALAAIMHIMLTAFDSKVRMFKLSQREALHHYQRCSGDPLLPKPDEARHDSGNSITIVGKEASQQTTLEENHSDVTVIRLSGYVFFATIPSLERRIRSIAGLEKHPVVVIDLTEAHRLETSVSQYLERQGREIAAQSYPAPLVLAGVIQNSGVHADLKRGGVACHWVDYASHDSPDVNGASADVVSGMPTFDSLRAALQWTKTRIGDETQISDQMIISTFCCLLAQDLVDLLFSNLTGSTFSPLERLQAVGVRVRRLVAGDILAERGQRLETALIIVRGRITVDGLYSSSVPRSRATRPSLKSVASSMPAGVVRIGRSALKRGRYGSGAASDAFDTAPTFNSTRAYLVPGDTVGLLDFQDFHRGSGSTVTVSTGPCWILEVDKANDAGIQWLVRARTVFRNQKEREEQMYNDP